MGITAEELISKIKVIGADSYERAMKGAERATHGLGRAATSTGRALASALSNPLTGITGILAGGALTAGITSLGRASLNEAANIERLTATFTALSGSSEVAREKMAWLKTFALTSIGEFDALAAAGTQLEAAGLNMERILPTLSNISAAFGGANEQVMELASAFSRMPSGVFGESMEIFRRFGITAGDLMAEGISISKSGEITASAEQMLTAVENIAKRKFGRIGEVMAGTLAVKLSNARDAWNQLLDAMGQSIAPVATKIINAVTPFVQFLGQSGILAGAVGKIAESVSGALGEEGSAITRFLAIVVAFVETVPDKLRAVVKFLGNALKAAVTFAIDFTNTMKFAVTNLANAMMGVVNRMENAFEKTAANFDRVMSSVLAAIAMFGAPGAADASREFSRRALMHEANITPFEQMPFEPIRNPFQGSSPFEDILKSVLGVDNNRVEEILSKFAEFQKRGTGTLPGMETFNFFNQQAAAAANPLMQTARNTALIAENTKGLNESLRRLALGGGERGRSGLTPVEIREEVLRMRRQRI